MFHRHEAITRGRRREHFQWNMDILGVSGVTAEAELIAAAVKFLSNVGITSDEVTFKVCLFGRCRNTCHLVNSISYIRDVCITFLDAVIPLFKICSVTQENSIPLHSLRTPHNTGQLPQGAADSAHKRWCAGGQIRIRLRRCRQDREDRAWPCHPRRDCSGITSSPRSLYHPPHYRHCKTSTSLPRSSTRSSQPPSAPPRLRR